MKRHLILALLSMVIFLSPLMSREAYGQNSVLRQLAKEDQDSRTGKSVTRTDEERIKIVLSLVTASIDRYLSFTEGYQKYGTNRIVNQETGKEELVPIDRKTSDSERAKYGVPPLSTLLKQFPEQSRYCGCGRAMAAARVPIEDGIVHSFRFKPEDWGGLWDSKTGFASFEEASDTSIESGTVGFVALRYDTANEEWCELSADVPGSLAMGASKASDQQNFLTDLVGIRVDLVMKDSLKPLIGKQILAEVVQV